MYPELTTEQLTLLTFKMVSFDTDRRQLTTTSAARSHPTVARFSFHRKVSPNEFCPRGRARALRRRRYVTAMQNIADRLIRSLVAQIGEGPGDSRRAGSPWPYERSGPRGGLPGP